jgi:hypothetical protein
MNVEGEIRRVLSEVVFREADETEVQERIEFESG